MRVFVGERWGWKEHFGHFENMTSSDEFNVGRSFGSVHERRAADIYYFLVSDVLKMNGMHFL